MGKGLQNSALYETIIRLEKKGKTEKRKVWVDMAKRLQKPSRRRAEVNVYKLNGLAKKNRNRVLLVPGKVLSKGLADTKIEVACLTASPKAREKIESSGGKVLSLIEFAETAKTGERGTTKVVIVQ